MKILVVDDEVNVVELLKFNLELNNYDVTVAYDGKKADELLNAHIFDLIILDIMLPFKSGLQLLKDIRNGSMNQLTPVLMLTAKSEESDFVFGLELGADDYLAKPFRIHELLARVKSLIRRVNRMKDSKDAFFSFKNFSIDESKRVVLVKQQEVSFTKKEFDLLLLLIKNEGIVFSRSKILDVIWGYDYFGETRTVDVHIRNIRKKIEVNPKEPLYIETIVGAGYKFKGDIYET